MSIATLGAYGLIGVGIIIGTLCTSCISCYILHDINKKNQKDSKH
jgi:hypothetical protein